MTNDDVISQVLGRIGSRVAFTYPGVEGSKEGILIDRVVVESTNTPGAVPYWDVVDQIEFKDETEPIWIRIGYYRKPKDRLQWGSQTTITEPVSVWKRLLVTAALEKPWFLELLNQVMRDVHKKGVED